MVEINSVQIRFKKSITKTSKTTKLFFFALICCDHDKTHVDLFCEMTQQNKESVLLVFVVF